MSLDERARAQDDYRRLRKIIGVAISTFLEAGPNPANRLPTIDRIATRGRLPYAGAEFESTFNPKVDAARLFVPAPGFLRFDLPSPNEDITGLPLGHYGEPVGAALLIAHDHLLEQLAPFRARLGDELRRAQAEDPDLDIADVMQRASSNGVGLIKPLSESTPEERLEAAVDAVYGVVVEGMTSVLDAVNFFASHRHPRKGVTEILPGIKQAKIVNAFATKLPNSLIGVINYNGLISTRSPLVPDSDAIELDPTTEQWVVQARRESMPGMVALRSQPGRATAGFICAAANAEIPSPAEFRSGLGEGSVGGSRTDRRVAPKRYFLDELTTMYCDTASELVLEMERRPDIRLVAAPPLQLRDGGLTAGNTVDVLPAVSGL